MIDNIWYKNAVIYSLDLETFMDGNGDGIGDFKGLYERLDYLHALGIDTIWLAPFYASPNKDNGYDISDFYNVDQRHGTNGEFVEFLQKAGHLGLRVIIDLVVNHTSDKHPWFKESRSSKDNPKRNWYVWTDEKPENAEDGIVFPGVQQSTWTKDKATNSYYFHRFYEHMPDLNTKNPEVREEICRIMAYWLQLGIAGFRMDAVPFILESPLTGEKDFGYLRDMRRFLQWRKGDAALLGEANVAPEESTRYFGEHGDGLHLIFNFFVNQYLFYALASTNTQPLIEALEATRIVYPGSQWAQFLRNHDELDLARLTDEERQEVFNHFGPEKSMQIYDRGIRRRLAPMLGGRQHMELAYSLMFALPGSPVIRYGDEIGMGEDLTLKERDAVRTPMQWSADEQAGFSTAKKLIHPVVSEGAYSYKYVNVENQRRDPNSLLNWMTTMIRLRKESVEIGLGNWTVLKTGFKEVLGMRYDWQDRSLFIWHNFKDMALEVAIDVKDTGTTRLIDLLNNIESHADKSGKHLILLESHGYRWFRAGKQ